MRRAGAKMAVWGDKALKNVLHEIVRERQECLRTGKEEVVEDLASRMDGVEKADVWECLRREDGPQGNAVKVAYMLLRDKRRAGRNRKH